MIFGVPLIAWLTVLGIGIGIAVLLIIISTAIAGRFERLAARTSNIVDDVMAVVLKNTKTVFVFSARYLGSYVVSPVSPRNLHSPRADCLPGFYCFRLEFGGTSVIDWWIQHYRDKKLEEDPSAVTTISAIGMLARIGLWSMLLLAVLDNFGIDVTALVTGLGIGGLAVALAVQNILSDIFASLSIVLDKPFVVGDFLVVGDYIKGTVEYIGLKTTRIRSISGEQIIVSNSDLLKSRMRNYKRMSKRRNCFLYGGGVRYTSRNAPGDSCNDQEMPRKARRSFSGSGAL